MDGVRTSIMPRTMKKRIRSAAIMMRLRLMRSLRTPAVGATKVLGQHLQHQREADGLGFAAGEIEQEIVEGEDVEPVAQLTDDLSQPQAAVVAVAREGECR